MNDPTDRRRSTTSTALPRSESTPCDPGEHGPPARVRVLDPADPDAIELARLYDVLRGTHEAETLANRALIWCEDRSGEEYERLYRARNQSELPRREAYWDLTYAVIRAHGGGTPWLSEWLRYGTAHRVVRVGGRVYSVGADYDADWPDDAHQEDEGEDHGMIALLVVDL